MPFPGLYTLNDRTIDKANPWREREGIKSRGPVLSALSRKAASRGLLYVSLNAPLNVLLDVLFGVFLVSPEILFEMSFETLDQEDQDILTDGGLFRWFSTRLACLCPSYATWR